jgi:integrase
LLFVVGINTALRISDLLQLRIDYFIDKQKVIRQRFWIQEQKRGKRQDVVVNDSIQKALEEYLAAYPEILSDPDHFVFFNTKANIFMHPIRRGQAWKIITSIYHELGLHGNYGTHSLRKTWGYHARIKVFTNVNAKRIQM